MNDEIDGRLDTFCARMSSESNVAGVQAERKIGQRGKIGLGGLDALPVLVIFDLSFFAIA